MQPIREVVAALGARRVALIAAVAAIILGLSVSLAVRTGGNGPMGYLFSELEPAAAKTVAERLTQLGVRWQLSPDGTAIMVPTDQIARLRMDLAGEQIGGKVGYEVLDAENPFGVSDQRARINQTRAIEGELARSIETLERVERARVHIVMAERPLFSSEAREASAAITLRTSGRLPQSGADAIRALVAAAVPELSPDRISIVDQHGALLARSGDGSGGAGSLDERQVALEARLRSEVEALLERAIGQGRVRVEVAAELARAARRDETERFDPDGQVVARQTTVESAGDDSESQATAGASIANQIPERTQAGAQPAAAGGDSRRSTNREVSEEVAYNSSRTRSTVVEEAGRLSRLTVSVMVDAKTATGRTLGRADIERLTRLVETAVGYDAKRGDKVVVEAMPLVNNPAEAPPPEGLALSVQQWITIGIGLLLAVALVAGALVLRRSKDSVAASVNNSLRRADDIQTKALEGGDPAAQLPAGPATSMLPEPSVAVAGVDGEVRASLVRQVGGIVAANPQEATALIRQMMTA